MLVILWDTRQQISCRAIIVFEEKMSFIPWAGMPLDSLQSSMRSKRGNTLESPQRKTSLVFENNFKHLDLATIGSVRSIRLIQPISAGHSGFFYNSIMPGIIQARRG